MPKDTKHIDIDNSIPSSSFPVTSTIKKSFLKSSWWLIIIFVLIIISIAWVTGHNQDQKQSEQKKNQQIAKESQPNQQNQNDQNQEYVYPWPSDLPECPNDLSGLFSIPLFKSTDLSYINPLGSLSPPGHILPVNHVYWILKDAQAATKNIPLFAPGDLHLVTIETIELHYTPAEAAKRGTTVRYDHNLVFDVCKGVFMALNHVASLPETLEQAKKTTTENCATADFTTMKSMTEGKGFASQTNCDYRLNLPIKAGEVIGYSGGTDMGVFDTRHPLSYANLSRYRSQSAHDMGYNQFGICPIDLYSGSVKNNLYAVLGDFVITKKARAGEPQCGSIAQDLAGTLQGNWFGVTIDSLEYEKDGRVISLIHQNFDLFLGAISPGSAFMTDSSIEANRALTFKPTHSGTHNREFSEVAPGNDLYCYDDEMDKYYGWPTLAFKYLIQLLDDTHIKIEKQTGSCGTSEQFNSPFIYER